jgi:hypothetical protein
MNLQNKSGQGRGNNGKGYQKLLEESEGNSHKQYTGCWWIYIGLHVWIEKLKI